MFQNMVSAGKPISKPVIIEQLSKNGLSREYNVQQVVKRMKCERKEHRVKKQSKQNCYFLLQLIIKRNNVSS